MRFVLGQKYVSKSDPGHFAHVVQLDDDGRAAWVQLSNAAGDLVQDADRVVYMQFSAHWTLVGAD